MTRWADVPVPSLAGSAAHQLEIFEEPEAPLAVQAGAELDLDLEDVFGIALERPAPPRATRPRPELGRVARSQVVTLAGELLAAVEAGARRRPA